MTRPRIGITTSAHRGWRTYWAHWLAIQRVGGRPTRLRADRPLHVDGLDGIVVGGGEDISAEIYGGRLLPDIRVDPERDALELRLLAHSFDAGLPVLGICRGAQMINVARGGSLHSDIHEVYLAAPRMRTILPRKTVELIDGTLLARLIDRNPCRVNALHHQAVDRLGDGLTVAARDGAGIVQGSEAGDAFVVGVQWHPELLLFDAAQQSLFRALIEAAARRRRQAGQNAETAAG